MYATADALLKVFRHSAGDVKFPQLWSDVELYAYMSEGQSLLAEQLLCIQDTIRLRVIPGVAQVAAPEGIIQIIAAQLEGPHLQKSLQVSSDSFGFIRDASGLPDKVVLGTDSVCLLHPSPSDNLENLELVLKVYRRPLNMLECGSTFEIPPEYRYALLDWMRHRAYLKDDAETFDRVQSNDSLRIFNTLVDGYLSAQIMRRGSARSGGIGYGGL